MTAKCAWVARTLAEFEQGEKLSVVAHRAAASGASVMLLPAGAVTLGESDTVMVLADLKTVERLQNNGFCAVGRDGTLGQSAAARAAAART